MPIPRTLLFLILFVLSFPCFAQDKPSLGVLNVAFVPKVADDAQRKLLTSLVRGRTIDLVRDSVDVIEGSKLERMIQVNAKSCDMSSCLAQFARSIGVDYLLATEVIAHKGVWNATVSLASASTSSLLAEKVSEFPSEALMRKGLENLVAQAVKNLVKRANSSGEESVSVPDAGAKKLVVKFVSIPEGASVSVDGNFVCTSPCSRSLFAGSHRVVMGKDGYRQEQAEVLLNLNGQIVSQTLAAIQTRLQVDAIDDRTNDALVADIFVNSERVGQTPFDDLVPVLTSSIEVLPSGYEKKTIAVSLEEGKRTTVTAHFRSVEPSKVTESATYSRGGSSSFTDARDGQVYKYVRIGNQTWMAENLNYAATGSWCYDDEAEKCALYGRLYDWNTVMNGARSSSSNPSGVRGICPNGWHVASRGEWETLTTAIGGAMEAGTKLKSTNNWLKKSFGRYGNGADEYGFRALPGGYRNGFYFEVGVDGNWWSATEANATYATYSSISNNGAGVGRGVSNKTNGFSLRCVKDTP